jgi:hypothetical protein
MKWQVIVAMAGIVLRLAVPASAAQQFSMPKLVKDIAA